MLPARAEGRFSMDLWSGLRAQQDIEPMKCGLLYFVHVPKTGCPLHRPPHHSATSLAAALASSSEPTAALASNSVPTTTGGTTVFNRLKDLGWGYNRLYWGEDDEESKRWVADPERWKNSSAWQWLQKSLAEHWTPRIILEAHHGAPGLEYMAKHVLNKVACTMQARGCQVRIVTMLRSPYDRTLSTLIFNSNGLPPEDNALGFLRWDAEEQARYLVAGHISQWPDEWRSDRPENVVDDKLVARAQDALSYAYLVGNLRQLDAFMESVYTLLGANKPAGGDENFNVNSQDAEVELSEPLRNMLHHVTQSDRYLYNTWFSGGKRPVPFQELCEEGSATQAEAAGIGLPPIMVNPLDWCWPLPWCIPRP